MLCLKDKRSKYQDMIQGQHGSKRYTSDVQKDTGADPFNES